MGACLKGHGDDVAVSPELQLSVVVSVKVAIDLKGNPSKALATLARASAQVSDVK